MKVTDHFQSQCLKGGKTIVVWYWFPGTTMNWNALCFEIFIPLASGSHLLAHLVFICTLMEEITKAVLVLYRVLARYGLKNLNADQ